MKQVRMSRFGLGVALVALTMTTSAVAQEGGDMASRMILELQQMREEVRELRGLVEAQAQEIENLRRRQRDQYLDLDSRIGAGGGTSGAAPAAAAGAVDSGAPESALVAAPPPLQAEVPPLVAVEAPDVRAPIEQAPEIVTLADPGASGTRALREPGEAERQAYDQAFLALRETRYADAAEGFDRFLRDYPDSSYAPNAMYWLGEAYYVTRDFDTALAQFQRLLETYPGSGKQPDALLKTGFSHYELGRWERARAALEQVVADHPGSNYSRLAENRLRTMRLEGHL
jgi:tol-pal system protein YbgF